jgi:cystathionine beta-lyase/cystathionine gamma-synthase
MTSSAVSVVQRVSSGLEVTCLDLADLEAFERALRPNTRMVWVETPSNPLLRLTDLRAVSERARRHGALTEDPADLIADLARALETLPAPTRVEAG